jgi:hypothetical protein
MDAFIPDELIPRTRDDEPGRIHYSTQDVGYVPTDGLHWGCAEHVSGKSRYLTMDDPVADVPAGFKGDLYLPQKIVLAAMIALEDHPIIALPGERVQTRIARISEKFSFGKTVLSLALICAKRCPAKLPSMGSAFSTTAMQRGFYPAITVRYERYLPATLVIASANVITQWVENTMRFTDLRYFVIEHVRSLRKFEEMYRENALADIDIIFMKAGKVTSSFVVESEPPITSKDRPLTDAFAMITEGVPIARVIIDDFDTLKITGLDCFPPALFTWLISATRRKVTANGEGSISWRTPEDWFRMRLQTQILGAMYNELINTVLRIQCDPALVDIHINSTRIHYRQIDVKGKNPVLLNNLNLPAEVLEMINADAMGAAASALGISAPDIGSLIRQIVGANIGKLQSAIQLLTRIQSIQCSGTKVVSEAEVRRILQTGTELEIKQLQKTISPGAMKVIERHLAEQRDKYAATLDRMRDNIREGHCQCCMVPFEKETVYILVGCCQIVVCEPCIIRKKSFITHCPNCITKIVPSTSLIRVGAEISLDAALSDSAIVAAPAIATAAALPQQVAEINHKCVALVQFIQRVPVTCLRNVIVLPYVSGLLDGKRDIPWPADQSCKFLIFTMHLESTKKISKALHDAGIVHATLTGSRAVRDKAIDAFRMDTHVLLATSATDCAGLDLPFISHVVFYHHVIDTNIAMQVAARGQRLGRTHNLEVVMILNESEVKMTHPAP